MTNLSFTPSWQEALNPTLIQRLMRPAQQAGLIRTQQAQTLLTRHQKMTAGLPLAALAQRGGALADSAAGQVPIVYAQPAAMGHAPAINVAPATPTDVHVHPTLPIANPLPSPGTSAAPTPSHTTVIQRKMMPGATPAALAQPAPLPAHAPDGVQPLPTTQEFFNTTPITAPPAPLAMLGGLPVVQPALVWADGAVVTDSSPAASSAVPVVRISPNATNTIEFDQSNSVRLMPLTSVLPAPTQAPSPQPQTTLWVVREQPAPQRMTQPSPPTPSAQALWPGQRQLPYIEAPQTHSTPNPANSALNETLRTQAAPQRTSLTHPIPSSPHRPNTALPPQPAQLNVDEIVDKVHRKFLRRLASEAERRGVR